MADDRYQTTDSDEDAIPEAEGDQLPFMPPLEYSDDTKTIVRVLNALKRAA